MIEHRRYQILKVALIGGILLCCTSLLQAQHLANPNEPVPTLYELLDSEWVYLMHEYPEWATDVGYHGQNGRWSDQSFEASMHRHDDMQEFLTKLRWGNRQQFLDEEGKLNFKIVTKWANDELNGWQFFDILLPISQLSGVQLDAASTLNKQPHSTIEDYLDILSRLRSLPKLVDQTIDLMERGIDRKVVQPKVIMRDVPAQVKALMPQVAMNSPLLESFKEMPKSISTIDQQRLIKQAEEIYAKELVPAFSQLESYIRSAYIPHCRETIGLRELPSGRDWYTWKVRHHTTTMMTPDQIYDLGVQEVDRIHKLMDSVRASSGFSGDLTAYLDFLRHDKQFFYTDSSSLVNGYKEIAAKANQGIPKLFGHLPLNTFEVKPIPLYAAPSAPTAYYEPGSSAAKRPGIYQVNTYDLASRPKWEMQPLSLHEAVPGHHLQISIADELEGLPELRKRVDNTAYVEGWALYSESLGSELGFYTTAADKMGQLSYEIWRAIRLVVDVGIHWKSWTRDQAIEFFTKNVGKASHDIEVEVDRYIADPGQAVAYKVGELKIKSLRSYAEKELGTLFDIRAFHDQLLSLGSLPLDLLDREMKVWVAKQKSK